MAESRWYTQKQAAREALVSGTNQGEMTRDAVVSALGAIGISAKNAEKAIGMLASEGVIFISWNDNGSIEKIAKVGE